MTRIKLSAIGAASALAFCATPTFAQSSVTLYGIVTTGVGWQNSQTTLGSTSGGRSATKSQSLRSPASRMPHTQSRRAPPTNRLQAARPCIGSLDRSCASRRPHARKWRITQILPRSSERINREPEPDRADVYN